MSSDNPPRSEIILYQTDDGRTRVQCRFEEDTLWLSQKLMAELFQRDVRTINGHLQTIFTEGELSEDSVIRNFRITAADGKQYDTQHYSLEAILAVGYRVKSQRGDANGWGDHVPNVYRPVWGYGSIYGAARGLTPTATMYRRFAAMLD